MPQFRIGPEHRSFAKEQRRQPTRAEALLWEALRAGRIGFKFKRQMPIGTYTADFVCLERRLIVELDGPPHDTPERQAKAKARDAWLGSQNFSILRLPNDLVLGAVEPAVEKILAAFAAPSPSAR
jgi:very-short-patch-repair endonuclease